LAVGETWGEIKLSKSCVRGQDFVNALCSRELKYDDDDDDDDGCHSSGIYHLIKMASVRRCV
jgi:hypothetical protein